MEGQNNMTLLGWIFMTASWAALLVASIWAVAKAMAKRKKV